MKLRAVIVSFCILSTIWIESAQAQTPAPPPVKVWTGNFGAGFAATSGNTDTTNINISLGLVRDPKKKTVTRINGLYLRGDRDSEVILNKTTLSGREEMALNPVVFV